MSYILRYRTFRGQDVYTVCSTGPPTPVVALSNYLFLSSPADFKPKLTAAQKRDGKLISEDELTRNWQKLCPIILRRKNADDGMVKVSATLPAARLLLKDCALKPNHVKSTQHFDPTDYGMVLFSLCNGLDITVHHGWLVEPENDLLRSAFASTPPNASQMHAINEFKSNSVNGLTVHGLSSLTADIEEGAFAILFRGNTLCLVCKYHGRLFELITDNNTCDRVNGAMWKTLSLSCDDEVFLASDFSSTPDQLNSKNAAVSKFIKQWELSENAIEKANDDKIEALFRVGEGSATSARNPGKRGKSKKKVGDEANTSESVKSSEGRTSEIPPTGPKTSTTTTSENVKLSGAGTTQIPPSGLTAVRNDFTWIRNQFKIFLNGYIDKDDDFPAKAIKQFYVRKLKELSFVPKDMRSLRMVVDYRHIADYDRELSIVILNDLTRLNDILREEFLRFLDDHGYHYRPADLKRIRLLIDNLPSPESPPESFIHIVKSQNIKLSQEHSVFTGCDHTKIVHPSHFGRIAGKGYFGHAVEKHDEELSWDGNFDLEHLAVKNGKFLILKPATVNATKESIYHDYKRITELLFPLYKFIPPCSTYTDYLSRHHVDGNAYIAYFNEQHDHGNSWDGKWDDHDMAVKEGKPLIMKPATVVADSHSKYNDFKNLILKLCPDYQIFEPAPKYLDIILRQLVTKMDLYDTDHSRFKTFQRFLCNNPGWKPPLVLSSLTQNIYKVCNSLRKVEADGKRAPSDKLQNTFANVTDVQHSDWQNIANTLWGFLSVYRFDNGTGGKYLALTLFCFLEYIRYADTHLLDFTKDALGEQLIKDIEHVILWVGDVFGEEMSALVLEMMHELSTPPFDSSWRLYDNSECGDALESLASTSGTINDIQSAGDVHASSGVIGQCTHHVQSAADATDTSGKEVIGPDIVNVQPSGNETGTSGEDGVKCHEHGTSASGNG